MMKEINYQIFDEESGLPIETLTDSMIREFAGLDGCTNEEMYNKYKTLIKRNGVKYMIPGANIPGTELKINCVPKGAMSACAPEYFDVYEDALAFIKNKQENKCQN